MFLHKHPYQPFIQKDTKKLIVGTLPPPRFSLGELLEKDVHFCYGSYYNSLWLYLDKIHNLNLRYDNSQAAINERKAFLIQHKIGVCDIVASCEREKIDASDLGMQNIKLRNIIGYLKKHPTIETLLFIGGNSKNGPEYFFRKHIKEYNIKLNLVSNEVPRVHQFYLQERIIKTVSLTSSSGSANRAIGSMPLYKQLKASNPKFNTFDFRVMQYQEYL
ncbi:uracil-DNA glycosylase family protein [Lacinutrix sp. C3R15]|uniref:uracil-DNA glycosylase family protein n=1 Tax=Flavobacteriaceae TaxID=49546 RepID=UPI001C0A16D2|nr:uracil-DNA glycosylase family protein [Oceanihabitans sp. 1_MG-2023]MBU2941017.1 uracil-DNA glycosylase family protein [Lacinutrix sp. C3R15]MDO6624336.1 uracil-DNA glycosylase family protein [Oceanihabitans sp. 1_MG-2023]